MSNKMHYMRRSVKSLTGVVLSVAMTLSGMVGIAPVTAGEAERAAYLNYLDELTPAKIKNTYWNFKQRYETNSDFVDASKEEGCTGKDFEIEPFEPGDTPQIMNKKILTQKVTENEMPRYMTASANPDGTATNMQLPNINGQTIAGAWSEMLCIAERSDYAAANTKLPGAHRSDLYYGENPIAAFENAVENDAFFTDQNYSRDINQIINVDDYVHKYSRAAIKYGKESTVYADIKERYKVKDNENNYPCYCMIVVNNIKATMSSDDEAPDFTKKLKADYDEFYNMSDPTRINQTGKPNYFGKPFIYVLFFHDFGAENRLGKYTKTISGNETLEELKAMGIECEAKDVKSSIQYDNKDESGSADLYAVENNTGSTATVTTSYTVEEGNTKSVTQECSYSKAFSEEASATTSMTYSLEVSGPMVTLGTELGFSATDTLNWNWESTKMNGTTEEESNVVTRSKDYSLEMPPYTKSTLVIQPTSSTITCKYDTMVSPTYKVDALLYDSYVKVDTGKLALQGAHLDMENRLSEDPMVTTLTNPDGYRNLTVDDLFKTAVVTYGHNHINPTSGLKWVQDIVDRGDHEAALILGGLYFDRPVLPSGGEFSYTNKGVRIKALDFEPSLPLSLVKPSVTKIDMEEGDTFDLEEINVDGLNYMGGAFYGFDKYNSGEWRVRDGSEAYLKVEKNKAGNNELKALKEGTGVIWFVPTRVDSTKLSPSIDIRGITVNVTNKQGGKDKDPDGKDKDPEKAAEKAVEEGKGSVEDTTSLTPSGKAFTITFESSPSENSVITVAKGNKFKINGDFSDFKSSGSQVKVSKKGVVNAKKATGSTPVNITFTGDNDGLTYTLSVLVLDPADAKGIKTVSGNVTAKKMNIGTKLDSPLLDVALTGVPLNAKFEKPVDKKGSVQALKGETSIIGIGSDGFYHLSAQLVNKGKVKIPFKVNGKKFQYTLKISK